MTEGVRFGRRGAAIAVLGLGVCAAPAAAVTITEFPVPTPRSSPTAFATAPDGAVFFSGGEPTNGEGLSQGSPYVGRIDTATNRITQFPVSAPLLQLTVRPGENAAYGVPALVRQRAVTRVDLASGATTDRRSGNGDQEVNSSFTAAPDGRLYAVTGTSTTSVVEVDPSTGGPSRTVVTNPSSSRFSELAAAPDGTLWTSETASGVGVPETTYVDRVDSATGAVRRFGPLPAGSRVSTRGLISDGAGGAWFTAYRVADTSGGGKSINHVDAAGAFTTTPLDPDANDARNLVIGPDRAVWFTYAKTVARLDPQTRRVNRYAVPSQDQPSSLTAAGDSLWFGEFGAGNVGRLDLTTRGTSVANATTVAKRGFSAQVACTAKCSGRVTLSVTTPRRRGKASASAAATRRVTLGARAYSSTGGESTVAVTISKRGRRLLASRSRTRVQVTTVRRQGERRTSSRNVLVFRRYPRSR